MTKSKTNNFIGWHGRKSNNENLTQVRTHSNTLLPKHHHHHIVLFNGEHLEMKYNMFHCHMIPPFLCRRCIVVLCSSIHRYSCCQVFVVLAYTCQRPFHPFTMVLYSHAIPTQPSTHHRFLFSVVVCWNESNVCATRIRRKERLF